MRDARSSVDLAAARRRSATSSSTLSPTAGMRAELVAHQAGERVVVLVLGQLDAGDVRDLVGAQQAGQRPGAVGPRGARARSRRSCSSATSPTISSTTSSSVTMPASRRTRRGRRPSGGRPARRMVSSGSSSRESGTTIGSAITCLTRRRCARSNGSATACLTCTVPTIASSSPSTGKRERPRLARGLDDGRRPGRPSARVTVRTRGVMISSRGAARRTRPSAPAARRCRRRACPARPSARTSEASSCGRAGGRAAPPAARCRAGAGSRWPSR